MFRRSCGVLVAVVLFGVGCSADPTASKEYAALESERDQLADQLESVETAKEHLSEEVAALQTEVDDLTNEVETLEAKNETLQESASNAEAELAALKASEAEWPGEMKEVFDMEVGDCFDDPSSFDEVTDVDIIDCDDPHDNEVYANVTVEFDSFPGTEAMQETADEMCLPEFEPYVGLGWETSELDYGWLYPTADSWADGDRIVTCFLYDANLEKLTGSMLNSGI